MKRLKKVVASMLALSCMSVNLVACDEDGSYTVTLMDGTSVIDTLEKDKETHLDVPSALTKDGYDFEGWYVDEALTIPYQPNVLSANLTLYAKYTAKTYYITFNLKGGTSTVNNVAVKKGEEYSIPAPTREGYTFSGWTLDGDEFSASGTYDKDGSVRLVANWDINQYTVTFKNDGNVVATQELAHGSKATAVETWVNFNAGYEIVGTYTDEAMTQAYDFNTEVKEGFTLYVKTQPRTFNLIVNQDGDMSLDRTVVYGDDYELPVKPTREGYIFKGYTYNDEEFATSGTYTYTSDIVVLANWEKDPTYGKSTISFYDGKTEIDNLSKIVDDGSTLTKADLVDAPVKAGYTFKGWYVDEALETAFEEAEITDDVDLYAKYEANTYLMTINLDGGEYQGDDADFELTQNVTFKDNYTLPIPVKNGYKFAGYTFNGKAENITGAYSWAENVAVIATWTKLDADEDEESDALFMEKGKYFKERESVDDSFTYVFVTGVNKYDFTSSADSKAPVQKIELVGAGSAAELLEGGKAFKTVEGNTVDFTLRITKLDKESNTEYTYDRPAKIVHQVNSLASSAGYTKMWGASAVEGRKSANFIEEKAESVMLVGREDYMPDLTIKSFNTVVDLDEAYMTATVKVNGNDLDASMYSIDKEGKLTLDESIAEDSIVEMTFKPKYALNNDTITMKVQINDGVNVYTNADLKKAYSDLNVHEINILRNITAQFNENEMVNGVPINGENRSVYARVVSAVGDTITINGNFFGIDGTNIPLMNNDKTEERTDWQIEGTPYYVNNVQVGLFLYKNSSANEDYFHNGVATFNNVYMKGNYTQSAGDVQKYKDKDLLTQSGTIHGIILRGGTINVDNAVITHTNIAMHVDGGYSATDPQQANSQMTVKSAYFDHSWSNQFYLFCMAKADISNSYLGDCSGAIIHVDDQPYNTTVTTANTQITVDEKTRFDNFVSGDEAWFRAHGQADKAGLIKNEVEKFLTNNIDNIQIPIDTQGNTMTLPNVTIAKKQNAQYMNFILVVRSRQSEKADASVWATDYPGMPYVEHNIAIYADPMKLAQGDMTGLNPLNMPTRDSLVDVSGQGESKQTVVPFSTALLGDTNATSYMYGLIEVMLEN